MTLLYSLNMVHSQKQHYGNYGPCFVVLRIAMNFSRIIFSRSSVDVALIPRFCFCQL